MLNCNIVNIFIYCCIVYLCPPPLECKLLRGGNCCVLFTDGPRTVDAVWILVE